MYETWCRPPNTEMQQTIQISNVEVLKWLTKNDEKLMRHDDTDGITLGCISCISCTVHCAIVRSSLQCHYTDFATWLVTHLHKSRKTSLRYSCRYHRHRWLWISHVVLELVCSLGQGSLPVVVSWSDDATVSYRQPIVAFWALAWSLTSTQLICYITTTKRKRFATVCLYVLNNSTIKWWWSLSKKKETEFGNVYVNSLYMSVLLPVCTLVLTEC